MFYRFERRTSIAFVHKTFFMQLKKIDVFQLLNKSYVSRLYVDYGFIVFFILGGKNCWFRNSLTF